MKSYVDKAMELGEKLGFQQQELHKRNASERVLSNNPRPEHDEEHLKREIISSSNNNNKETLTLSGTLSAVNANYGPG